MKTIEQMTTNECPELMEVIISIQLMQGKCNIEITPLSDLMKITGEELHSIQDELIPLYNKTIKL